MRASTTAASAVACTIAACLLTSLCHTVLLQCPLAPRCIIFHGVSWGLGNLLVNMLDSLTLERRARGGDDIVPYYDHSPSNYLCTDGTDAAAASWRVAFSSDAPLPLQLPSDELQQQCTSFAIKNMTHVRVLEWARLAAMTGIDYMSFQSGRGLYPEQLAARRVVAQAFIMETCPVVRAFWKLAPPTQAVVDVTMERLSVMPRPLVAFHVRGGDKVNTWEMPPEYSAFYVNDNFTAGMSALKARYPGAVNGTCVLVGDDAVIGERVAAAAEATLGCGVVSLMEPKYQHFQKTFNNESLHNRCVRFKSLVADTDLLARADYTVGTAHSNVDDLAIRLAACVYGRSMDTFFDAVGWDMNNVFSRIGPGTFNGTADDAIRARPVCRAAIGAAAPLGLPPVGPGAGLWCVPLAAGAACAAAALALQLARQLWASRCSSCSSGLRAGSGGASSGNALALLAEIHGKPDLYHGGSHGIRGAAAPAQPCYPVLLLRQWLEIGRGSGGGVTTGQRVVACSSVPPSPGKWLPHSLEGVPLVFE